MNETNIWFGLTTFLGGSLITGVTAYFAVMRDQRDQLTKEAHATICADKQQIVTVQLLAINEKLAEHGKKLDRLLLNGRKGGSE